MNIESQKTTNIKQLNETGLVFHQTNETSLTPPLKQIAQESKPAWLPNPVVHRAMSNATQAQRTIAAQLASSSSGIENLTIALEVLQDRNYQSSTSSTLRLQVTGQALGGASKHELQQLRSARDIAQAQVNVYQLHIIKIQKKYDKASTSSERREYTRQLRQYEKDIINAREVLAAAQQAYTDAGGS